MEEQLAFSDWINTNLGEDLHLTHILPLADSGLSLYDAVKDGILLCKIVNHSCSDNVDKRVINIVLGLLWQIIRVSLEQCPGLANLLEGGEQLESLMKMSPEAILLRWVNYQLERAGVPNRINNFTSDIKNSEAYTHLLHQIASPDSGVNKEALMESDLTSRAELMLQQADKLGCRSFISAGDVTEGVYKLNLAFVANLFNNHPSLDKPDIDWEGLENLEETREEKSEREIAEKIIIRLQNKIVCSLQKLDELPGSLPIRQLDVLRPG